jgi:predicted AAA+ superfamily ATPase
MLHELFGHKQCSMHDLWLQGGYPRSILAPSIETSAIWRIDFIRTFLERDIALLRPGVPPDRMHNLWQMCAHMQGQTVNYSKLGSSLGVTDNTIRNYLELLCGAFMIRLLRPFEPNVKKRIVKSPKIFIRDSGLLHSLLNIETMNSLLGNPVYGASWEGYVIETICAFLKSSVESSFYRSAQGAELDLVLRSADTCYAFECKASKAPSVTKGFWSAIEDVQPEHTWIVAPIDGQYQIKKSVTVISLSQLLQEQAIIDLWL